MIADADADSFFFFFLFCPSLMVSQWMGVQYFNRGDRHPPLKILGDHPL